MLNNGLISERDINITNRSYEDKSKIQSKKKNKFKLKKKYIILFLIQIEE